MIQFLTWIGTQIDNFIVIGLWMILYYTKVQWQCRLCGKTNKTNMFKFLFLMCDHEGNF